MLCTTESEWQNAIGRVQKKVADLPSLAQFQVAQEALYTWQWARATWSPRNPSRYWTGRYRGSVTIGFGRINLNALPEHPDAADGTIVWPPDGSGPRNKHPDSPYMPVDTDQLMLGLRPSDSPPVVYVSVTLPYAERVEQNSPEHPRALAWEAAAHHPYNWQALIGSLTS